MTGWHSCVLYWKNVDLLGIPKGSYLSYSLIASFSLSFFTYIHPHIHLIALSVQFSAFIRWQASHTHKPFFVLLGFLEPPLFFSLTSFLSQKWHCPILKHLFPRWHWLCLSSAIYLFLFCKDHTDGWYAWGSSELGGLYAARSGGWQQLPLDGMGRNACGQCKTDSPGEQKGDESRKESFGIDKAGMAATLWDSGTVQSGGAKSVLDHP